MNRLPAIKLLEQNKPDQEARCGVTRLALFGEAA